MYRTKEQVGWDNRNTANFAGGRTEGKKEVAMKMLKRGINVDIVAECCNLPIQEIELLKNS